MIARLDGFMHTRKIGLTGFGRCCLYDTWTQFHQTLGCKRHLKYLTRQRVLLNYFSRHCVAIPLRLISQTQQAWRCIVSIYTTVAAVNRTPQLTPSMISPTDEIAPFCHIAEYALWASSSNWNWSSFRLRNQPRPNPVSIFLVCMKPSSLAIMMTPKWSVFLCRSEVLT